jgi:hypothetical protein
MSPLPAERPRRHVHKRSTLPLSPYGRVFLPTLEVYRLRLTLQGLSPLVMHAFSDAAKQKILAKHLHRPTLGPLKPARDFDAEYEACFHRTPHGVPAVPREAIHASLIGAAKAAHLDKATVRMWLLLEQRLYPISGPPPQRFLDFPRLPKTGEPYPVYRPRWWPWSIHLSLIFYQPALHHEQILHLVQLAGLGNGLGDGRPNTKRASVVKGWGRWRVDPKVTLEPVASLDDLIEAQTWEEFPHDV